MVQACGIGKWLIQQAGKSLVKQAQEAIAAAQASGGVCPPSCLRQWPVQIKLAPAKAEFFAGSRLLIAADCAAYAYADFHARFMQGQVTLIGCPKLDGVDYADKLREILKNNDIRSVQVARMSVPCCRGLEEAAVKALQYCGKLIPRQVSILTPQGEVED